MFYVQQLRLGTAALAGFFARTGKHGSPAPSQLSRATVNILRFWSFAVSTGNMRRSLGAEVWIHLPWRGNGTTYISASASPRGSFFRETLLLLLLLLPFEEVLDPLNIFREHLPSPLSSGVFPMMGRQ